MTSTSLPAWATVGAEVVIDYGPDWWMTKTSITEVTATSIVTLGARKFTPDPSRGWVDKGCDAHWLTPTLIAGDDPRAVEWFAEQDRGTCAGRAEDRLVAWRREPTASNAAALRAALDALAPYLLAEGPGLALG